jgi:3-phosphoshikimate 1-carboxyvinyltransferase
VPGDISSAAFWLVAAAAQPGSRLLVRNVGLNPTRTGIIDVLFRMGARIRESIEVSIQGEPLGNIDIKGTQLRATTIQGAEIPNVIDEIPILSVAAALAEGTTVIRDASELRVKETDRIAAVAANLRAMGATVEEFPDGMAITGGSPLKGTRLPCYHDHRIAMAFAVAGLFADGETIIEDTACVDTSYPGFAETLREIIGAGHTAGAKTTGD